VRNVLLVFAGNVDCVLLNTSDNGFMSDPHFDGFYVSFECGELGDTPWVKAPEF
jgi:hypothetical protein